MEKTIDNEFEELRIEIDNFLKTLQVIFQNILRQDETIKCN